MDAPTGVTQDEGRTGFLTPLPSAVLALLFIARRIQPFLSLVDRGVEFVPNNINIKTKKKQQQRIVAVPQAGPDVRHVQEA